MIFVILDSYVPELMEIEPYMMWQWQHYLSVWTTLSCIEAKSDHPKSTCVKTHQVALILGGTDLLWHEFPSPTRTKNLYVFLSVISRILLEDALSLIRVYSESKCPSTGIVWVRMIIFVDRLIT